MSADVRAGLIVGLVALVVGVARPADAAELHSFFDGGCRRRTGIVVYVTDDAVALVDLAGAFVVQPRDEIASVTVHTTLENPLARIALSPALRAYLRDVWVGDDDRPTFTGWTTAFFDDLFLYVDLEGQTHVLDPEEIRRIRPTTIAGAEARPRTFAAVELAFPAELIPCGESTVAAAAVLPSRVIADRIKVGDYLTNLEERYREQAGLEERTRVYAEPFLFDLQSRLGLLYDPESTLPFPLYFRWSNGRPYRFQSLNVVGNASHEWLPTVAPSISVRSDIKSHFFSGTFIGHVLSLPAGTDAFLLVAPPDVGEGDTPRVEHSYNYVLLMGADWWRLSLSAGASYLAGRISVPEARPRTVLAGGLSPTVRLRYQGPGLQLRALYFRTRTSGELNDALAGGDPFGESPLPEAVGERFRWRLDTVRVGATWRILPTIELMVDGIGSRGAYADAAVMNAPVAMKLWETATAGEIAVSFGRYVTVKGSARLYVKRYTVREPEAAKETVVEPHFGGALEFVF